MIHYFSMAIAIFIGAIGQVFLKQGAILSAKNSSQNLFDNLANFHLLIGLSFYGISTIFYLFALQKIPLSVAYPSLAIGYILVLFASRIFFKETLNFYQISGVILIILGVSMLWKK